MNETETDSDYDYYCVDCHGLANPQDKVCPHCGADISEIVEENEESQNGKKLPACPLCKGQRFRREEGRLDSMWGFSSEVMILLICEQCQYVLTFHEGDSIWDLE